jgi:hypothetical protein
VSVTVERVEWPTVVLGVRNDSAHRFPIYADHILHVSLFRPDGSLVVLAPATADPLTAIVGVRASASFAFQAPPDAAPGPDGRLVVAMYKELKYESDLEGLGVYALGSAERR